VSDLFNFAVTGFVGKDAEIRQFTTASPARFSPAVAPVTRRLGEETNRVSAFINIEAWRKNENATSFDMLTKGTMLNVEGYFILFFSQGSTFSSRCFTLLKVMICCTIFPN